MFVCALFIGTHYTVMRNSQDGNLFAVPQFHKDSLSSGQTASDASGGQFTPCSQCMSSWQAQGSAAAGENGEGRVGVASSKLGQDEGCHPNIRWNRVGEEENGPSRPCLSRKDSKWVWV